MGTLLDVVNRTAEPAAWAEGENIPWDDPAFSERMLAEHLCQEHELASRTEEAIDDHVEWIRSQVLGSAASESLSIGTVLDLACGPGLYALRLARVRDGRSGCETVGIDFSPASIRHAKELAAAEGLPCTFHHADVRDGVFGEGFDLVMMIYGQFNVFPRDRGLEILKKAHAALKPGGSLLLEVQSKQQIQAAGEDGPSWYSAQSGLFSSAPHLVLQENFWDPNARASTHRFSVIDAQTAAVSRYALSNEAYAEEELTEVLRTAGFKTVESFPALNGSTTPAEDDLPVVVARS